MSSAKTWSYATHRIRTTLMPFADERFVSVFQKANSDVTNIIPYLFASAKCFDDIILADRKPPVVFDCCNLVVHTTLFFRSFRFAYLIGDRQFPSYSQSNPGTH